MRPSLTHAAFAAALLAACAQPGPDPTTDPVVEPTPTPADSEPPAPTGEPGPTELRRLTRAEWLRSVRDLFHLPTLPAVNLPRDLAADGFDNQAASLGTSPIWVETYERATEAVVRDVLDPAVPSLSAAPLRPHPPGVGDGQVSDGDTGRTVPAGAVWRAPLTATYDGTWSVRFDLRTRQVGDVPHPLTVQLDGQPVGALTLPERGPQPTTLTWTGPASLGAHELALVHDPTGTAEPIIVVGATLTGPTDPPPVDPTYAALVPCDLTLDPLPCASEVLTAFAPRAWRRPLTPAEHSELLAHAERVLTAGGDGRTALEFSLRATLGSANFLFKVEGDPSNADPAPHPLTAHELATRLSYLVWSSLPDPELQRAADDGSLLDEAVLTTQLTRLLRDPRSEALRTGLLAQWFLLPALAEVRPDVWTYPAWDEALRQSMHDELDRLLGTFVDTPRDLRELLTARTSTLDARLAEHYGLPPQTGLVEHDVAALGRGGVLGTGALLTVLSHTNRTSPTRRGAWMLTALWCDPPGSPPSDVPPLAPDGDVRDQVAAHAREPGCAACHTRMDPLGLALEGFDPVGQYHPEVDATGTLPDGTSLDGLPSLQAVLHDDPRFTACVVRKVFTWALGRPPAASELLYLTEIEQQTWASDGSLATLLAALVQSEPFRTRRADP